MCSASVLHSFSGSVMPGPVMPMDVAMRLYISHSPPPPLRGFLSSYEDLHRSNNNNNNHKQIYKPLLRPQQTPPLRPCLSSSQQKKKKKKKKKKEKKTSDEEEDEEEEEEAGGRGGSSDGDDDDHVWRQKRVVFADSKGMSLTAIHVFSKFDDEPFFFCAPWRPALCEVQELQFDLLDLDGASSGAGGRAALRGPSPSGRLEMDFAQPSADYLDFRRRLLRDSVCLESCSLQERALAGTVKVRNVGFAKAVTVRATFDAWASHTDVEASFMNNVYGCQDADTFAFVLELPSSAAPSASCGGGGSRPAVEFCVRFQAEGRSYWDNNDGRNYCLRHVGCGGGGWSGEGVFMPDRTKPSEQHRTGGGGGGGGKLLDSSLDFDQFGSPRMSSGMFPGWQSWGGGAGGQAETSVPYW